jgi:hypothetical protein
MIICHDIFRKENKCTNEKTDLVKVEERLALQKERLEECAGVDFVLGLV